MVEKTTPITIARLEKDMEALTKAMATMANGMAKMADMHVEQQLMKQDFALKHEMLVTQLSKSEATATKLWAELDNLRIQLTELVLRQQPNSAMTAALAKLGWLILGSVVATVFYLARGV